MSNFHTLEVVDRGSETQPQVGEKLFYALNVLVSSAYSYRHD